MWCTNSLPRSIRKRLMGGLEPKAACGRCQLYMCIHAGKSAARCSEVSQGRAQSHSRMAVWMKLGAAIGPRRVGLGPDAPDPERLHAAANARDV